jgi:hypothetical protein
MMLASRLIKRAGLSRIAGACLMLIIMIFVLRWNYEYCRGKEAKYIRIGTGIEISVKRRNSEELYETYGETIEYYRNMKCKYHHAAWQPWLTLVPDPPEPELGREYR